MAKKEKAAGTPNGRERKAAKKAAGAASKEPTPKPIEQAVTGKATTGGLPPLPRLPKSGNGARERKPKPVQDCTCGCGGKTTGAWVPGHDARARGWAMRIGRGLLKMADVPENERPGAKFMLKDRAAKGLTGKGVTLVKGKTTEDEPVKEEEPVKSDIDMQVEAAIADGMSPEAAEGLRASLEAAVLQVVNQ